MAVNSKEYWRKREEENLKKNLKTEEEYIKTINGYYDYMMDQVQKEINGFYTKYAKKEGITLAEAKKRVSELDIKAYERKAEKYVRDKEFSDEANEEMMLYNATMKINRLEMLKANIGMELVDGFNDLQKYFGQVLNDRTLGEFERQAGILGKTIKDNAQAAHAIVNASFANAKFSDRIWMYQDMMKAELSKLLQEGLIQGRNPRQLARHLEKLFGASKSDAERLMRTELARVQIEAQKQSFEQNGFKQYEFIALGSACEICKELDGKHFDVEKMMPGENAPPMHPNCRCSAAAYEDSEGYEEWLDYLDKGGTTEEWNKIKLIKEKLNERKNNTSNDKTLGKRVVFKNPNMSNEEYTRAKEMWSKFEEVKMSQKEKEHVYEELDNNLTSEEKENALVNKAIGDYHYYAVNKGHNQYKIYKKVPIESYDDIVDEVLSEMFGRDWKVKWEEIERSKKNL